MVKRTLAPNPELTLNLKLKMKKTDFKFQNLLHAEVLLLYNTSFQISLRVNITVNRLKNSVPFHIELEF